MLQGRTAVYLGSGALKGQNLEDIESHYQFAEDMRFNGTDASSIKSVVCDYSINIYATSEFAASYYSRNPAIYTTVVVLIFFCTAMTFLVYDFLVERRQTKVMRTAERTTKIVASLFPKVTMQTM